MADGNGRGPLALESNDLIPLPTGHRQGLAGVAVLAFLSFISSAVVLFYLTFKLVRWHLKQRRHQNAAQRSAPPPVDLSLGLAERHLMGEDIKHPPPPSTAQRKKTYPNQFLVLVYNLLLADLHQAAAFLLNVVWVGDNGITVRTSACWAQGWLVSTGDLSSSLFITAIAVHTYLAVVWRYTPPQLAVYATIIGLWVFNYLMAVLGIAITDNGKVAGGFYVRAAAWCWVNVRYERLRLFLHYLWIFIAFVVTAILYLLIFFSLRRQDKRPANSGSISDLPATSDSRTNITGPADPSSSSDSAITTHSNPKASSHVHTTTTMAGSTAPGRGPAQSGGGGHHRGFLLYPLIYILCTAPLALGRVATMAGADVPIWYFCLAGALITSNGWLDVLLWGVTRHRLLFSAAVDSEESGLDTFTFMRTPSERRFGNMIWVEGGRAGEDSAGEDGGGSGGRERRGEGEEGVGLGRWVKRRMGWRPLFSFGGSGGGGGTGGDAGAAQGHARDGSRGGEGREEGMAIQMDMVTTVVVESAEERRRSRAVGRMYSGQ
ncbi:G protein-coupled glucose receptor regulating Gpa2-domain-containing protein [Chaetomium strumarium]|uniref:G protein-coupled glucose receptor regulating Gpa2-domain-containing protein n=1 Tax=Chaetomium strumarium TaxID=1170767 RepID=A0AAJ0M2R3_9PEZI|nr:G protein-coupled glucose receptor regulating Gpa2-domain-containing protein [Chaetomium strumarium]